MLKVTVFKDERTLAKTLAAHIAATLDTTPDLVLGLPTGRTPVRTYHELGTLHARGRADFSRATTFNLDEFLGIGPDHPGSYRAFMETHLFSHVNMRPERINVLIDATHPYAATMSDSAARAVQLIDVRLLALRRPAWVAVEGDRWTEVADAQHAVSALGQEPRHVFLTLGRQELGPFRQAPQHHYLIRSVDPVSPPLAVPHATYMTARGPFTEADDLALLKEHGIDVVVSKNSGGPATYSKIAAARTLGIEVVMITRPQLPEMPSVDTVDAVMEWLDHADAS